MKHGADHCEVAIVEMMSDQHQLGDGSDNNSRLPFVDGQTRRGEEASNENDGKRERVVSIGDKVSALWNGKSGGFRWFPNSTIVKLHEDGHVDVLYEDGDREFHISPDFIKINGVLLSEASPGVGYQGKRKLCVPLHSVKGHPSIRTDGLRWRF